MFLEALSGVSEILTWVEGFTIYSFIVGKSTPFRWVDLSQYKLLIIQTAKKFPGRASQNYGIAFNTRELHSFHTRGPFISASCCSSTASPTEPDHNSKSYQICLPGMLVSVGGPLGDADLGELCNW